MGISMFVREGGSPNVADDLPVFRFILQRIPMLPIADVEYSSRVSLTQHNQPWFVLECERQLDGAAAYVRSRHDPHGSVA